MFVSIQRWIYSGGDTLPNALRTLADEIEKLQQSTDFPPEDEFLVDNVDSIIAVNYCDDPPDDNYYRAGICMSFLVVK